MATHLDQATRAATVASTAAFSSASVRDFTLKDGLLNLTRLSSAKDLTFLPYRWGVNLGNAIARSLNLNGGNIASLAMAEDSTQATAGQLADAAFRRPGVDGTGWRRAFGEAFQLSNVKSYWGMLHYITSRWAFATFSMVCLFRGYTDDLILCLSAGIREPYFQAVKLL